MRIDGARTQDQLVGHLGVRQSGGHKTQDIELAIGLLHAERVITSIDDVAAVRISAEADEQEKTFTVRADLIESNAVDVQLAKTAARRPRRSFLSSSACGVCGATTMDDLAHDHAPLADGPVVDAALLPPLRGPGWRAHRTGPQGRGPANRHEEMRVDPRPSPFRRGAPSIRAVRSRVPGAATRRPRSWRSRRSARRPASTPASWRSRPETETSIADRRPGRWFMICGGFQGLSIPSGSPGRLRNETLTPPIA